MLYLHFPASYMPYNEPISFFPLLFVVWMPTACLAAGVANYLTQQRTKRLRIAH